MRIAHRNFVLSRPEADLDIGLLQGVRPAPLPVLIRAPERLPVRFGYTRARRYSPAGLVVAIVAFVIMMVAGAGQIHGAAGGQGHHAYCK